MNHNELTRMAREAGLHLPYWDEDQDPKKDPPRWTMVSPLPPLLERFAALVSERDEALLRQALEALERARNYDPTIARTITALRERLGEEK